MNYSPPIGGDFFISFLLWHIGYDDGHDRCGGAVGAIVVVGLYFVHGVRVKRIVAYRPRWRWGGATG